MNGRSVDVVFPSVSYLLLSETNYLYLRVGICDLLHHYPTWYDLAEHWCSLITNQACTANSEYAVAFFQGKHTDVDEIHAFVCGSSVCSISWKLSDHAYLVQC